MSYSNRVASYDGAEVNIIFFGPVSGLAKGTFIDISRDNDAYADEAGADGEILRGKSNDRRGTATIRLMQSSQTNQVWSALQILDENSPNGDGIGPFFVKDNSGTTLCAAAEAWITKPPTVTFADTPGEVREWNIRLANLEIFVGGN